MVLGNSDLVSMDPLSVIASIAGLADTALRTTSAIISFVQDAQNASTDRFLLAEEAQALSKLLEWLRRRAHNSSADDKWLEDRTDVLRQFQKAYEDLANPLKVDILTGELKRESRFKAIRTATKCLCYSRTHNSPTAVCQHVVV